MSSVAIMPFVVGITVLASFFYVLSFNAVIATSPTFVGEDSDINTNTEDTLSTIFDNVSNSIVQIVSITPPLFSLNPQAQNTTEVGAGFIYDDIGHIVTANHVLAGANIVSVVFKDGDRYDADVVGRDAFTDTAVLKIVDNNNNTAAPESVRSSQPVTLGNSSALKI